MKSIFRPLQLCAAVVTVATAASFAQAATDQTSTTRINNPTATNVDKAGDFGLGIQWGQNTGIEAKYWRTETAAIGFGAAFADGNTAVNADYLVHYRQGLGALVGARGLQTFIPYAGGGLVAAFGENTNFFGRNTGRFGLAARIPLGIEFLPHNLPIGVYGQLAPSLGITPSNYTFLSADIGARYYF